LKYCYPVELRQTHIHIWHSFYGKLKKDKPDIILLVRNSIYSRFTRIQTVVLEISSTSVGHVYIRNSSIHFKEIIQSYVYSIVYSFCPKLRDICERSRCRLTHQITHVINKILCRNNKLTYRNKRSQDGQHWRRRRSQNDKPSCI